MMPKIQQRRDAAVALLSLAFLLAFANGTQARAGPRIEPTYSPTPTATATVTPSPSNTPTVTPSLTRTPTATKTLAQGLCGGFMFRGYCTPGSVTYDAWMCRSPGYFYGAMSSYAPGVMEMMEDKKGVPRGQGITVMSCGDLGRQAWIRFSSKQNWIGPFTVVDCSMPEHLYYNVVNVGIVAEIGNLTVEKLGIRAAGYVEVGLGGRPSDETKWHYRSWWMSNCMEFKEDAIEISATRYPSLEAMEE